MTRRSRQLPARLAAEIVTRCARELAAATALVFAALDEMARPLAAADIPAWHAETLARAVWR